MNYDRIIIEGYNEKINQKTSYTSYFKRQARIAQRDNFVEFADFFNACKLAIGKYKQQIENQYNEALHVNDIELRHYSLLIKSGFILDRNGIAIQSLIDNIEKGKKYFEEIGYRNIWCDIKENGENPNKLYFSDIEQLEQSIIQAEQELTNDNLVSVKLTPETPPPTSKAHIDTTPQQSKIKPDEDKTDKTRRQVNEEGLRPYFASTFKGMGNGNINHFTTLVEELKTDRTAKEFAQIAYMIYQSKQMNDRRPSTFAGWYKIFCENIEIKQSRGYKPNSLKNPSEAIKKLFNYL